MSTNCGARSRQIFQQHRLFAHANSSRMQRTFRQDQESDGQEALPLLPRLGARKALCAVLLAGLQRFDMALQRREAVGRRRWGAPNSRISKLNGTNPSAYSQDVRVFGVWIGGA